MNQINPAELLLRLPSGKDGHPERKMTGKRMVIRYTAQRLFQFTQTEVYCLYNGFGGTRQKGIAWIAAGEPSIIAAETVVEEQSETSKLHWGNPLSSTSND